MEFRRAIGNRIYGCDDCQLVCPWNKFARPTAEKDFAVRHGLDQCAARSIFLPGAKRISWKRPSGSAIRRIGYERWLRNIAIALGNAPASPAVIAALAARERAPISDGARTRSMGTGAAPGRVAGPSDLDLAA